MKAEGFKPSIVEMKRVDTFIVLFKSCGMRRRLASSSVAVRCKDYYHMECL